MTPKMSINTRKTPLLLMGVMFSLFFIPWMNGSAALTPDFYEDNDTFATASSVSLPFQESSLTIDTYDDVDFYNLTLSANTVYYLEISGNTEYIDLAIFNFTDLVEEFYFNPGDEAEWFVPEISGEYCIGVVAGDETYYAIDFYAPLDDYEEQNDDMGSAAPEAIHSTMYNLMLFDEDWFSISLSDTDYLQINVTFDDSIMEEIFGVTIYVYLYDPSDNEIMSDWDNLWEGHSLILRYLNPDEIAGTYHVLISSQSYGIEYTLDLDDVEDDAFEDNDVRTSATPLVFDNQQNQHGLVLMDNDWYSISITNTSHQFYVVMATEADISSLTFSLTDAQGVQLFAGVKLSESINMAPSYNYYLINYTIETAGTYYIYLSSSEDFLYDFVFSEIYTSTPADVSILAGSVGNLLEWSIYDTFHFYAYSGGTIQVYREGVLVFNEDLEDYPLEYSASIDGLNQGTYEYEFRVIIDGFNIVLSDTVMVTVGAGDVVTVNSPSDMSYIVGATGKQISWTPQGVGTLSTFSYEITRNGTSLETGSWTSGTAISISVEGLALGSYEYVITLTADDISIQDTVVVNVTADSSSNPTPIEGSSIPGYNGIFVLALIGIVGIKAKRQLKK